MQLFLKNVRCFGDERTFTFKRGEATLLSAPSGYGKSTIFDAIRSVIWGSRSIAPNFFKPPKSRSEIKLIDDVGNVLERTWRPATIKFTKHTGEVYTASDAESIIANIYGTSPNLDIHTTICEAAQVCVNLFFT